MGVGGFGGGYPKTYDWLKIVGFKIYNGKFKKMEGLFSLNVHKTIPQAARALQFLNDGEGFKLKVNKYQSFLLMLKFHNVRQKNPVVKIAPIPPQLIGLIAL